MQVHLYLTCADSGVLQFVALRRINNLRIFNIMMSSTPGHHCLETLTAVWFNLPVKQI